MKNFSKTVALMLGDVCCIIVAYILALLMRFEFVVTNNLFVSYLNVLIGAAAGLAAVKLAVYWAGGLYHSLWKYAGSREAVRLVFITGLGNALATGWLQLSQQYLPRGVNAMVIALDVIFIGGLRLACRMAQEYKDRLKFQEDYERRSVRIAQTAEESLLEEDEEIRVMIVGAGDAGASLIREIRLHPENRRKVVAAIDDDRSKRGRRISGVKIAGGRRDIRRAVRKYGVDEIIIAIPSAPRGELQDIAEECSKTRCKIQILPGLIDIISDQAAVRRLRDIDIEDLLSREAAKINLRLIGGYLEGRIVLVSGGGGSVGSELCRQICRFKPRRLVAVDICEDGLLELSDEMEGRFPDVEFDVVIGSVRDRKRMEEIFQKYKPHAVFHAAAYKSASLLEDNPREAIVNNLQGTGHMLDLAEKYAVSRFVFISSDEAFHPTSVIGAAKWIGERMLREKSADSLTSYAAVRFGDVLESSGSILPAIREQIARGGPVTVSHPESRCDFMPLSEAVGLVLQAGAMAEGGEVFVLDMGKPVRMMDLAEKMIRLSGFEPHIEMEIKVTGPRLQEEPSREELSKEKELMPTAHKNIFLEPPTEPSASLKRLLRTSCGFRESIAQVEKMTDDEARAWLLELTDGSLQNFLPAGEEETKN